MTFADWKITKTNIFMPILSSQVAVTDDLHFFLLDFQGKVIHLYGQDGSYIKTLGGPGDGPEKIRGALNLYTDNKQVYVIEPFFVRIYDKLGFVKSIRKSPVLAAPVIGGMVWYEFDSQKQPGDTNQMFFAPEYEFDQSLPLFDWKLPLDHESEMFPKIGEKLKKEKAGSPKATSLFQVSNDLSRLYFKPIGHSFVLIYDVATRREKRVHLGDRKIGRLRVDALDYLWVYTADGAARDIKIFDREGRVAQSPFTHESLGRVCKVVGDWAYVTAFRPGVEEVEIFRCKLDEVESFIAANPISTDW
ncbi:MAG: hypothetical protein QNK37_27035 [Acidobacteriota bacterium]|nr:hypothetical protein [Acidobacteriota bacterium]